MSVASSSRLTPETDLAARLEVVDHEGLVLLHRHRVGGVRTELADERRVELPRRLGCHHGARLEVGDDARAIEPSPGRLTAAAAATLREFPAMAGLRLIVAAVMTAPSDGTKMSTPATPSWSKPDWWAALTAVATPAASVSSRAR